MHTWRARRMSTSLKRRRQAPDLEGNLQIRRQHPKRLLGAVLAVVISLMVPVTTASVPSVDRTGDIPTLAFAASPAASPVASPVAGAGVPSTQIIVGQITIEMTSSGFQPSYFESAVGRDITITVVNSDSAPHNFTVEKLDISVDIKPGESAQIQIAKPRLGHYEFFSNLPGDEHLVGAFSVFI